MKNTEYPTMIKMNFAVSQWRNGWHCMSAALLLAVLAASNRQARADIALVDTAAEAGLSMSIAESGQNSVTITNFTVSPMANVLVVLVEDKGASAVNSEPATLTWGSQTILKAVAQDNPNTNLRGESIYYLFNPTPGTNTIAATVANNPLNVEITAYTLSGVNTTVAPKVGSGGNIGTSVTFTVSGVVAGSWAAANTTWSSQTPVPTITGTGGSNFMTSFLMVDNQSTILTAGYIAGLSGGTDTFAAAWATGTQKNNFAVAVFTPLATAINIKAASATPNPVPVGTPAILSVTATSTGGTITNVVVNASAIGGPSALQLNLSGGNIYTNTVTATIATLGAILPVTLQDNSGNTLAGSVRVVVQTLADQQFDAYNKAYLIQTQNNLGLVYYARSLTNRNTDGGWTLAIDIEGAEDAYEYSHSPVNQQLVHSLCTHFLLQSPTPWDGDYWNDDIGWFALVLVRGYQMTGNVNFLNAAEYGFNMAFARGWDTNFNNGGIWERQPSDMTGMPAKNPLACDSLLQVTCMIYQSTGDTNYLNRALQIYSWVRTNIFNPSTGQVYGQVDTNGVIDTSSMLYNQGTFTDCANLLHNITGQQMYYDDAHKAVDYAIAHCTVNGIFSKSATYLYTWAAEFARGMGHFVKDNDLYNTYYSFMQTNVNAAWNCRRTDYNISWNVWTAPTPTTNDLSIGWAVNAVAMLWATPQTQPGLVAHTNPLSGTVIGTAGTYGGGMTIDKVFDKNLSTYFDAPTGSGAWVGLDFGVGVSNAIAQINYWPRSGWAGRMVGGVFQGDNNPTFPNPVTLYTITTTPPDGALTSVSVFNPTAFRYVRYLGPANGWCNVAELQFFNPDPFNLPLAITAGSQSKTYGKTLLLGTTNFTATGLATGDSVTSVTLNSTGTVNTAGVGNYAITPSAAAGSGLTNYNIRYLPTGQLTVNPAVLGIAANNTSRAYAAANPTFAYTPSGFVLSDGPDVLSGSPSLTTAANVSSPVGTFAIMATNGNLSAANYTFSFTNGTLTITPAISVVNWPSPASVVAGTPLGANQCNATAVPAAGNFNYQPASGTVLPVGTNLLTVVFTPNNTNYTTVTNGVPLVVTAAPLSPNITSIGLNGTGLSLAVTNGTPGGAWALLQSTNIALPLNQWPTNLTGTFDDSGNLSTKLLNAATNTQEFYLLKVN